MGIGQRFVVSGDSRFSVIIVLDAAINNSLVCCIFH